ncbi:MAG: sodium:alanine symporter family protein [Clostridia bacterium]|nr:sodium:alanine symporter family protein [Clostridia bacterium]
MQTLKMLHSALYGLPALCLIIALFVFINVKTGFAGIVRSGAAARAVLARKENNRGGASPLKSAFAALSATVGTGNIVGAAGAVTLGGPGAVFWMWAAALLALSVKFAEIYLSKSGSFAFAYIRSALGGGALRVFCLFGILTAVGIGNITQTNAAAQSAALLFSLFGARKTAVICATGACFALLGFIILYRRIAVRFCERLLPFMAAGYVILCLFALFFSRRALPRVLSAVLRGAFDPEAVTGGAVGSAFLALKSGISRGVFSNEAGLGNSAISYEKSEGDAQTVALFGIFEVFVDTLVLCTLTALVVLCAGSAVYGADAGALTALFAFSALLGKKALFFFCPAVVLFAFSSLIGWGIYAGRFAEIIGLPSTPVFAVYCAFALFGAVLRAESVWQIAEICTLFMMAINLAAVAAKCGKSGKRTSRALIRLP